MLISAGNHLKANEMNLKKTGLLNALMIMEIGNFILYTLYRVSLHLHKLPIHVYEVVQTIT